MRKKRFTSPASAWVIVEGPGKGKKLDQFADEKRKKRSDSNQQTQKEGLPSTGDQQKQ